MINKDMLINDYMVYLATLGKSKETQRSYKTCVKRFFNDIDIEDVKEFNEMNTEFFLDYANSLREEITVATINKHMKQLSSFYQYLVVKGIANSNPCYKFPKLNNNDIEFKEKVMSKDEVKSILKVADTFKVSDFRNGLRDKTIIYLLLNCGLRIGELSRIEIQDIDLGNNKLWVRGKGHNGNISRYTNFNNITKGLIEELINKNPNRKYLFENYKEEKLAEGSIRKIWHRCCDIANVKGFTPHSCRHFLGSSLVEKGVELKKVAQVLGHSSQSTTEKYYVRPKESMNDILDVVDIF